jgi:hypothetical protein
MQNPILLDLPPLIQTQRLLLRPPQAGDGKALFEAVSESLPELRRFLLSFQNLVGASGFLAPNVAYAPWFHFGGSHSAC